MFWVFLAICLFVFLYSLALIWFPNLGKSKYQREEEEYQEWISRRDGVLPPVTIRKHIDKEL